MRASRQNSMLRFMPSFIAFGLLRRFPMLPPLHDARRRKLLNVSALLCAIPILLAPIAGRSSFELASEQAAFNERFAPPAPPDDPSARPMPVSRDPFVPDRFTAVPPRASFSASCKGE